MNEEHLIGASEGAEIDCRGADERIIRLNGGVDVIVQSPERNSQRNGIGKRVGTPHIVIRDIIDAAGLSEKNIFLAGIIEQDVKGSGNHAIDAGMKKVTGRLVEFFHEDAERVVGIEAFELRAPQGNEVAVAGRSNTGMLQLIEQTLGGVGCKAHIHGEELLIEDRGAEESGQLLLFDGIARKRQGVPQPGKDKTSDAAFEWLEKSDFAFGKVESDVRLANLNAVFGRDGINRLAVELKSIKSSENLARGARGAGRIGGKCARGWRK